MLHWAAGAEGKGVVCSADIAIVNLDRKSFAFMRSILNHIPLSEKAVHAIAAALMPLDFIESTATTSSGSCVPARNRSCRIRYNATLRPSLALTT